MAACPSESPEAVKPFQIDFDSLVHSYFFLDDVSREELQDLYRLPYFFKAVAADAGEKTLEASVAAVVASGSASSAARPDEAERASLAALVRFAAVRRWAGARRTVWPNGRDRGCWPASPTACLS